MWNLILRIAGSTAGIWLADRYISGVQVSGDWKTLLIIGAVLGLANLILKPILDAISLPLKIITLGLFSLVINMGLVWLVDIAFPELVIQGIAALFWTTALVWLANYVLAKWMPDK
jgi:putative membrane protein